MKTILLVSPIQDDLPISLAYVGNALHQEGVSYDILDLSLYDPSEKVEVLETAIASGKYDAVGSGGMIGSMGDLQEIFSIVKGVDQKVATIMGGRIASTVDFQLIYDNILADYIVIGNAEYTMAELLHCIRTGGDISKVQGVSFRTEEGFTTNEPRPWLDLQSYPFTPRWEGFDMDYYFERTRDHGCRIYLVMTNTGCNMGCSYCFSAGGRYRERSIDQIMDEIREVTSKYDIDMLAFASDVLFFSTNSIIEFAKAYKESEIDIPWLCSLRGDVNLKVIKPIAEAGCKFVTTGMESANTEVLKSLNKPINTKKYVALFDECKRNDINVHVNYMFGAPGENKESIRETFDFAIEHSLNIRSAVLTVYYGTELYKLARDRGLIKDEFAHHKDMYLFTLPFPISKDAFCRDYVNISELTSDELYDTLAYEHGRASAALAEAYSCDSLDVESMTGKCAQCGATLTLPFTLVDFFQFGNQCPNCLSDVNYAPYRLFKEHCDSLRERITKAKRVALFGCYQNTAALLKAGQILSLPSSKIVATFGDETTIRSGWLRGFRLDIIHPISKMDEIDFDMLILADASYPQAIVDKAHEYGLSDDAIVDLLPSNWHEFAMKNIKVIEDNEATVDFCIPASYDELRYTSEAMARSLKEKGISEIVVGPPGMFARTMAGYMETQGITVQAFFGDHFKSGGGTIDNKPCFNTADKELAKHQHFLISTPSYWGQEGLKNSLLRHHYAIRDDNVSLYHQLYINEVFPTLR